MPIETGVALLLTLSRRKKDARHYAGKASCVANAMRKIEPALFDRQFEDQLRRPRTYLTFAFRNKLRGNKFGAGSRNCSGIHDLCQFSLGLTGHTRSQHRNYSHCDELFLDIGHTI